MAGITDERKRLAASVLMWAANLFKDVCRQVNATLPHRTGISVVSNPLTVDAICDLLDVKPTFVTKWGKADFLDPEISFARVKGEVPNVNSIHLKAKSCWSHTVAKSFGVLLSLLAVLMSLISVLV